MSVFAAVVTGKGTGAIATIQLYGDSATDTLKEIFIPQTKKSVEFTTGRILLGAITDNNQTIDQVTIGCEGANTFAVNCHGNPLIVERIMQLLRQKGVQLLTAEQLLCKTFAEGDTIALEAKLTLPKAKTIEGTKIILNQIDSGLTAAAKNWLQSPLSKINAEAREIIEAGQIARLIIFGCKIVLAGPPNTGKSTLFNQLCGRQKSIVTDIKGTTRDWVSAEYRIACGEQPVVSGAEPGRTGPMSVELVDTAGLYEGLKDDIDETAQQAASELINQADMILLVLDNSEPATLPAVSKVEPLTKSLADRLADKKVLTVLNKSDLPARFDPAELPADLASNVVRISALLGTGLDTLAEKICEVAGVANFDLSRPVCFTTRQEHLLTQLSAADSQDTATAIITKLLSGQPDV